MGRARLHRPSPQIRLPCGGGVASRRGTGFRQQLPELEEAREAGGPGGNTPPPAGDDDNNNTGATPKASPLSGPLLSAKHPAKHCTCIILLNASSPLIR